MAASQNILQEKGSGKRVYWYVACGISVALFLVLLPQLFLRYHLQTAADDLRRGDTVAMASSLEAARSWLKYPSITHDKAQWAVLKGEKSFLEGENAKTVGAMLVAMENAHNFFRQGVQLQSLDIDGWTGLARSTEILERIYPFVKKKKITQRGHYLILQPFCN